jgi:membrane associated rhomboid family serine protease
MFLPFGSDVDETAAFRQKNPVAVYAIVAACVLVHYILSEYLTEQTRQSIYYEFGTVKFQFRWWMPITCTFIHGGYMHLIGNMYFLWIYGKDLERLLGSMRFLVLYASGSLFSIGVHLLTLNTLYVDEPTIGASGAISALLGAYLVLWPGANLRCLFFSMISFRPIVVLLPAWVVLGLWFGGQLIHTLQLIGEVANIAFWAHIAGFVAGAAVATLLQRRSLQAMESLDRLNKSALTEAWQAVLRNDMQVAAEQCQQMDERAITDAHGACQFLRGMIAARHTVPEETAAAPPYLIRAFCQARDYRQHALLLTIYLQMLKTLREEEIPGFVHRDAGHAAMSLSCPKLALSAFYSALHQGCTEGLEAMHRAVLTLTRPKPDTR